MKRFLVVATILLVSLPLAIAVWAQVANVRSTWVSGELVFEDASTATDIMVIKDSTDGVNIKLALDCDSTLKVVGAVTASNNITCASTVQAEQLTSTDDLTVTDDATISGSLVVSENITCATTFTLGTRSWNVTQYSADPNAASWLATVSGLDADDYVIATLNTAPSGGAYILSAVASVGGATITMSADPNESVKITIISLQD